MLIYKIGHIVGFANLVDINNHFLEFQQAVEDDKEKPFAKSMLLLIYPVKIAYAHFASSSLSGYDLYPIFREAVERLERCGFKVIWCTCDGLSVNCCFFKLHGKKDDLFKVLNPYSSDNRYINFFSNPPHLIKTVRNCWASKKRLLWVS